MRMTNKNFLLIKDNMVEYVLAYCFVKRFNLLSLPFSVSLTINLNELQGGEQCHEWYNLQPVNLTTKGNCGSLRCQARYLHEIIMPLEKYSSMKEVGVLLIMDLLPN